MAKYQKTNSFVSGAWVKAGELKNGITAKIVSETNPQPSQFQNKDGSVKMQDVAKVKFENMPEAFNVSLNRATINGLVGAFGEDSAKWQGHELIVETEKMRVAGKAVVALYLIPKGYHRIDDENGYAVIVPEGEVMLRQEARGMPQADEDDYDDVNAEIAGKSRINPEEIPF